MQCAFAILSSGASPAVQYFSTFSLKRHDFGEKFIEQKKDILIFSTSFVRDVFIRRRIERDIVLNLLR